MNDGDVADLRLAKNLLRLVARCSRLGSIDRSLRSSVWRKTLEHPARPIAMASRVLPHRAGDRV